MRAWTSCILILVPLVLMARIIHSSSDSNVQLHINKQGRVYILDCPINLHGDTLNLAANSSLKFINRASLENGTVCGNNSTIDSAPTHIFNNITVIGSWSQDTVYGQWFTQSSRLTESNAYFNNLMVLSKGSRLTHLYTPAETLTVDAVNGSGVIKVPSNVYWHNLTTISLRPNNYEKFSIIHLDNVNDVTIDGGAVIGDVDAHIGEKGEWGHGIKCGGAKNIIIRNIECNYCWGDGIDLIEGQYIDGIASINCDNILIENAKCLYNRRQGMSIEAATNVLVKNSVFSHTGAIRATPPTAGIDIEPWSNNCDKIYNIEIDNCSFYDNGGFDITFQTNLWRKDYKEYNSQTYMTDCKVKTCEFKYAGGVNVNRCNIDSLAIYYSANINFEDSNIKIYNPGRNVQNINFINSKVAQSSDIVSYMICFFVDSLSKLKNLIVSYENNRHNNYP